MSLGGCPPNWAGRGVLITDRNRPSRCVLWKEFGGETLSLVTHSPFAGALSAPSPIRGLSQAPPPPLTFSWRSSDTNTHMLTFTSAHLQAYRWAPRPMLGSPALMLHSEGSQPSVAEHQALGKVL